MLSNNSAQQRRKNLVKNKLCIDCYLCKVKNGEIYCKEGYFSEKVGRSIIYTAYDFDCCEWEEG